MFAYHCSHAAATTQPPSSQSPTCPQELLKKHDEKTAWAKLAARYIPEICLHFLELHGSNVDDRLVLTQRLTEGRKGTRRFTRPVQSLA